MTFDRLKRKAAKHGYKAVDYSESGNWSGRGSRYALHGGPFALVFDTLEDLELQIDRHIRLNLRRTAVSKIFSV